MLKKSPRFVLAGHCRLTISAAFTSVPCLIRHGVKLKGSTYDKKVRFPAWVAAALLEDLFEHPADHSTMIRLAETHFFSNVESQISGCAFFLEKNF